MIRVDIEDSFRLYPGSYECKWGVDPAAIQAKLAAMSDTDLLQVAHQVDEFWSDVSARQERRAFAASGGAATKGIVTPAKIAANRRNAKRGGRPRKSR